MPADALIALAKMRIRHGALPCFGSSSQYAGSGEQARCGVCYTPITARQVGFQVEPDEPQPEDQPPVFLHAPCHQAWLVACQELMPEEMDRPTAFPGESPQALAAESVKT